MASAFLTFVLFISILENAAHKFVLAVDFQTPVSETLEGENL